MNTKSTNTYDVIVVGSGVAGLSAAVAAVEAGKRVAVVERAEEGEHGGNTRYTEAYLRVKSLDEVSDDFEPIFADNPGGYVDPTFLREMTEPSENWSSLARSLAMADPELISTFSSSVGATLRWLQTAGVRFEPLPVAFHVTCTTRLLPVGGGLAIVDAMTAKARELGVEFHFSTTAHQLELGDDGHVTGLKVIKRSGERSVIAGGAVILASGGFEGNPEMLTQYLGAKAMYLRPVARGGYYNKGEGIRMALSVGAAPSGEYGAFHAELIDPRSGVTEPSIFIFPYGILVNKDGERFTDEAPGSPDFIYERVTRRIFEQREGIAYLIVDSRINDLPNWRKGARSDVPPIQADTLEGIAEQIGVPADRLMETVAGFNTACQTGDYDPLRLDGLATTGIQPRKSNWAAPISSPPYLCYPVIAGNVFTFGGLRVNRNAQVLTNDGEPIGGLYAAGETMGIYFGNYTGSTSVLRGAVFGRIAGQHAATRKSAP